MSILFILSLFGAVFTLLSFLVYFAFPIIYQRIRISRLFGTRRNKEKSNVKKDKKESKVFLKIFKLLEGYLQGTSIPITTREFILVVLWINILLLFGSIVWGIFVSMVLMGITNLTIMIFIRVSIKRKKDKILEQLPDILSILSNSLKSGYSILQAFDMVAEQDLPPISIEFKQMVQALKFGDSFENALHDFMKRLDLPDLSTVIETILITRETGGNLTYVIDGLIEMMNERRSLMGEVKAISAQGRISAFIIGSLPTILFLLLYIINREYMGILLSNMLGIFMIIIGVVSQIIGILLIRRIIKIKVR